MNFAALKLKLNLKVTHRLYGGFALVGLLLAAAVVTSIVQVSEIKAMTDRIVNLRTPTSQASASMTNDINESLAELRGWMLTGNAHFKSERAQTWENIAELSSTIDQLSTNWTNQENVANWQEFKRVLAEFETAQAEVEAMARSADEQPALRMLVDEAAPRAAIMASAITEMIDLEIAGGAGANTAGDRVQVLGTMADVRGTLGLGLANIRAYLLTGEPAFVEKFDTLWAKNTARFADLESASHLMSRAQRDAFDAFSQARAEFDPLPATMFEIRGSDRWNMANYLLVTEAAPRAEQLLATLVGVRQEDGARTGGMVENQRALLESDATAGATMTSQLLFALWVTLGAGIVIAALIAFFTGRSIAVPLVGMTAAMKRLAEGDLEADVPARNRRDEIGEMSAAVQVFKENAIRNKELEAGQEEQKRRAEEEQRRLLNELADDFESSVGGIVSTVAAASTELQSTAEAMASIAEETSSQAVAVSSASEEASANVQTVASSTEEMTASIGEIAERVGEASAAAKSAVAEVAKATGQMGDLAETAEKVGDVVSMISGIAEQTNLLALNATIESARAGEAGRGFAVVANEVKALASQTGQATDSISEQIQEIQNATGATVASMGDVAKVIDDLEQISATIAAAMEEQGAVTQEIARSVQEAASGTQQVTENISGVTQASQEAGSASSQVMSKAGELSEQAESLKGEVDKFVSQVRTG